MRFISTTRAILLQSLLTCTHYCLRQNRLGGRWPLYQQCRRWECMCTLPDHSSPEFVLAHFTDRISTVISLQLLMQDRTVRLVPLCISLPKRAY